MKFAGHTTAFPRRDLRESITLFADLGFDGIEVVLDKDLPAVLGMSKPDRGELVKHADDHGIEFACLSPLLWHLNAADDDLRNGEQALLGELIVLAHDTHCRCVRVHAGRLSRGKGKASLARLIEVLTEAGSAAGEYGVALAIQPHRATLAPSAKAVMDIIDEIGISCVGALYDQVQLAAAGGEEHREAIDTLKGHIKHCHMSNILLTADGASVPATLSDGVLCWPDILRTLQSVFFEGYLSYEYPRKRNPNLPPAETEMKRCLDELRAVVGPPDNKKD